MQIIRKNYDYDQDIDVLVRVYENQEIGCHEERQIACEVLFKPHTGIDHKRATSWLPRGAVHFVVTVLNAIDDRNMKVQISNELADNIGVLTSCSYAFDQSMEWRHLKEN